MNSTTLLSTTAYTSQEGGAGHDMTGTINQLQKWPRNNYNEGIETYEGGQRYLHPLSMSKSDPNRG